jgi:hypothetical protein
MPFPHELVGDLQHGGVLVRHFFAGDDVEAHIDLASLPQSGVVEPPRRRRQKFAYITVPDEVRRYDALASAELGVDVTSGAHQAADGLRGATILSFVGQGIVHIFTGYDHVLFILTLVFAVRSWRHLAVVVTSFTAAHSITLALASFGVIAMPGRVVEPAIALTVLVVAVDAILRPRGSARAEVAFAFGLIHGLGLSTVLRDAGLTRQALVPALFGFNVGVEIGQLMIVGPAFALVMLLRKNEAAFQKGRRILCASVAVVAVFWILIRLKDSLAG